MSTIALLGGTGKVGRLYAERALAAGHAIRALARDTGKLEIAEHSAVTAIRGDATSAADVDRLVAGADVVVSCVGNPTPTGDNLIMEATADNILAAAARQTPPPRCIFISTIGCGGTSWLIARTLSLIVGRRGFADYEAADLRIRTENEVPFTLVRPYALTDGPGKGSYNASSRSKMNFARPIARADVAEFLLAVTTDPRWDGPRGVQLTGA